MMDDTAALTSSRQTAPVTLSQRTYTVWPASLDDALQKQILELMNRVLETEDTIGFPGPLSQQEGAKIVQSLAAAVSEGAKHVLLMFEQGTDRLIGHLIMTPSGLPNCRHVAEISRVFVHPDYRGLGAIRVGFRYIVEKCQALGVEILTLDVRADTRIHKLWTAMGFETIGTMQDYARIGGKSYAGCYMYQSLRTLQERMSVKIH